MPLGDRRKVKGRAPGAPDPAGEGGDRLEDLQVARELFHRLEGETGADQGMGGFHHGRDGEALRPTPGPASLPRGAMAVSGDVEDGAGYQLAVDGRGDRDRPPGVAMQVVRGTVERIDDPDQAPQVGPVGGELLAEDPGIGLGAEQLLGDPPLGGPVNLGDEVVMTLHSPSIRLGRGGGEEPASGTRGSAFGQPGEAPGIKGHVAALPAVG